METACMCALTFVIHLIGTLAYAVRIAGVRTRRIAVSFALFNVLVLVSRTSNSFQGPSVAKRIEVALNEGVQSHLLSDLRWLMLSATAATIIGARPRPGRAASIHAVSSARLGAAITGGTPLCPR
jgi:hypothetical protein